MLPEVGIFSTNSAVELREQINEMIRENLPELTLAYNDALKKEAEKQEMKRQSQKEVIPKAEPK